MKRVLGTLAALAMTCALAVSATVSASAVTIGTFSDVSYNNWAYPYVQRAAGEGWVDGVGDGRFAPDSKVTGGQFVTMVARAFFPDEVGQQARSGAWYQSYVDAANAHGLLTHGINTQAVLDGALTRYNMAVVLYNLADEQGMLTPTSNGFLSADGSKRWSYSTAQLSIADWNNIPAQYREAVLACYAMGYLSGTDTSGTFSGGSTMNRAQAATVLCRANDDPVSAGTATALTKEQAQQIALQDAGVTQSNATFVRVYEDWENGRSVYEVEFYAGGVEYDYEIDKTTGSILSKDWDIEGWVPTTPGNPGSGSTGSITQEQAKEIALKHAGLTASQVTFYRVHEDWENGRTVYDVEFYSGNMEYDYEIDKATGTVLSWDMDIEGWVPSNPGNSSTTNGITQEQAKEIALKHAGITAAEATFYRVKEDWDHGRTVYEVEFYAGYVEYDYEIDKATGNILSWDSDIEGWAPSYPGTGTGTAITLEQAKQLVLDRVPGMPASAVRIHQDWDDGRFIYEGEAWYNYMEYEFEIDASTGRFLSWESDWGWD